MELSKIYSRIFWKNKPDRSTAIDENNLNKMDNALNEIDNRVVGLDISKANKTELNNLINSWTMDEKTGIITITKVNGEQIIFDLNIEKIPASFSLSDDGILIMTTDDGTVFTADIGSMIPILVFNSSDTISVLTLGEGINKTYSFSIKEGSITEKYLQANYLEDIKVEVANAEANAKVAAQSAANSNYDAKLAQSYAIGLSGIREGEDTDNAKYYNSQTLISASSASDSASIAMNKATAASNSADNAALFASSASTSETNAINSATTAASKASDASAYAFNAKTSETNAATSESNAYNSATKAESYALGGTGTRENEDIDNAKYYYEQAKSISESCAGALRPMGTVTFANLPAVSSATEGDMYNISDEFVTTSDFKEGAGHTAPAGSNVYKTVDGKWDILAGTPVTGIKGSAETTFRHGNINITPENLGITVVNNTADSDKSVKYATSAGSATSAIKATQDNSGNNINSTYIKELSVSNNAITYTKGDGNAFNMNITAANVGAIAEEATTITSLYDIEESGIYKCNWNSGFMPDGYPYTFFAIKEGWGITVIAVALCGDYASNSTYVTIRSSTDGVTYTWNPLRKISDCGSAKYIMTQNANGDWHGPLEYVLYAKYNAFGSNDRFGILCTNGNGVMVQYASNADHAGSADYASIAYNDGSGNNISDTYALKSGADIDVSSGSISTSNISSGNIYYVKYGRLIIIIFTDVRFSSSGSWITAGNTSWNAYTYAHYGLISSTNNNEFVKVRLDGTNIQAYPRNTSDYCSGQLVAIVG